MAEAQATPDIAVIGMAGRLPGAHDLTEFWHNLRDGVESVTVFPEDELADHVGPDALKDPAYVRAGAVLDDIDRFDARFFGYSAREAALLDPQHRLLLECAWHALEDAGHPEGGQGVGVYAGCSLSGYLLNNLLPGRRVDASAAGFELLIANDKDYLASRIGYKLGLEGPAVSVQTACSSSLVAVHLAVQALLSYECDLALAGGATVRVPHRVGYLYEEGMILSPDGHCRPFDADANGTIGGSGAGMVVLKRLDDALADGDRIDAVIKGSALTNDGADKVGYTAPGVHGQAAAIAAALAVADIDADTVTAVEAHGTGTPLGDPVEIAALTEAFRASTDRSGYCALGSVKANIGHLDSAAGVSGLLKAILQLKHRRLAPVVNFREPNPRIDFAGSPFFVNDRLRDWEPEGGVPRRIGVSSFGFGGTNAHVVLEEAPEPARPAPARRALHLLTLSARTPEALDAAGDALGEALRAPEAADLADIAHTLHRGRKAFEYRRAVVGRDHTGAAERLTAQDATHTAGGRARGTARVALLLTGQGSQYPGMGRELYDREPGFAERVDACADLLRPHLGRDLRDLLYPRDTSPEGLARAAEELQRTEFAQPALFTVEYATAGLLADWGLRPAAMLGHSVGEITAACLSGALTLPDAARLVARRGALMQELEPGSMLSVNLDEDTLRARLPEALAVAAVNAPLLCVVAGPDDAVDAFARELERDEIGHRRLHTSHAFHSPMIDPVLPALTEECARLTPRSPEVPYLSNRTGDWITAAELADPAHWAEHARGTVRFGDGVRRLLEDEDLLLVEVGPGRTLSTLARGADGALHRTIVPVLPEPGSDADAQEFLLTALGRLWTAGADLDWEALDGTGRRRVALPGYAFQRRRYWIEAPASQGAVAASLDSLVEDDADTEPVVHDSRPALSTAYQEPRGPREAAVAAIWEDLLGVAPVGVHDSFIELGGHSLLATQVVARIRKDLGVTVPMRDLVRASTVAAVAELVAEHGGSGEEEPVEALPVAVADPDALYEPFPLTEIQQAQWIGRLGNFTLGNVAAHIYWEVENTGIDLDALESAWVRLMARHPMLNAVLTDDGRQRVLPDPGHYAFDRVDLREVSEEEREARLEELRHRISHEMRPTDTWPLFGITAVHLPGDLTRLYLSFDLLIADIGSIRILLQEWRTLYDDPGAELPEIGLSYRDYVLAAAKVRGTSLYERSLDHWRRRVAELPPTPELPLAVAPSEVTEPRFTPRSHVLPKPAWQRVKDQAAAHGVTPSAVLLAAYATVLGRWSRSPRFTLNVTVINRIPVHPDADRLVGEFASFDLLPVDLERDTGIADVARALQEHAWEDLEHRYVNGVDVLRELARQRGGTSGSVMPIVFTSTLVQDTGDQGETLFDWLGDLVQESVQTPQVWIDAAVLETSKGLYLSWPAVEELFPAGLVDEMFAAYCRLLADLAADDTVWTDGPGELAPADHGDLVARVNDTAGPVPEGLLHAALLERAAETPEKAAVVTAEGPLSYGELRSRAAAVARGLLGHDVAPGELVAVSIGKGREQVVAALGVLMAGGAYLPVDPELPAERRHSLMERAGSRVVVTSAADAALDWPDGTTEHHLDLAAPLDDGPVPQVTTDATDLAYVIYTSGSTGVPKGVAVSHRAALNTCVDINERFGVTSKDVVLGLSSLSFDLSVYDVFGVLGAGGTLVLPRPGTSRDPGHWLDLVTGHGVTVWNSVPALMGMFVEHAVDATGLPLKLVLMSGDWIPVDLPDRIRAVAPAARVVSLGGATEAAIWSIAHPIGEVDPTWESIPYGRPLRNQRFHVLDGQWRECPVWVPGELFIAGTGLADGYWRDPERTAASFVTHPVSGERLYRTGDVGRWLPSGDIEFLGREDFQVKVGGFRIELGEIEAALAGCEGVRAAVAAAPGARHHRRLVGYVVPEEPGGDQEELLARVRAHAEERLPAYMVPPVVMVIDAVPLSANGKVDRSALPDPAGAAPVQPARASALGPTAVALAALAAEIIGIEGLDPHADFFTLGGDSIMGVQLVSRAGAQGMDITAADLFLHRTIADLAAVVDERSAGEENAHDDTLPLTPYQRQLYDLATPGVPTAAHRFTIPVDPGFAPEQAEDILVLLRRRHPGLRMRFVEGPEGPCQIETDRDADADTYVPLIDLTALPAGRRAHAMEQMADEMAEELDPAAGLTVKAALFDLGPDDRRFVWLSHALVTDLRSVQLLLTDFSAAAELLRDGKPTDLLPPTRPFPRWARNAAAPTAENDDDTVEPGLPADGEPVHRFSTVLDRDEAERLLAPAAAAYRLTGREIAFAALASAAFDATGQHSLRFAVEDDARSLNLAELDVSESVGAFSRYLPVTLERHAHGKTKALLTAAKERLRAAAREENLGTPRGDAFLLLRDLDDLAELPRVGHPFTPGGPVAPPAWDPGTAPGHPLVVTTYRLDGRWHLDWACRGPAARALAEDLAERTADALRTIADHCSEADSGTVSPSDFPLAGLDQSALAALAAALGGPAGDDTGGDDLSPNDGNHEVNR